MRRYIEDYRDIVGDEVIYEICKEARKLYGKHILHINSTYQGGGVAEILSAGVSLMNDVGVDTGWRILHGSPDFFTITKKFHNALQGEHIHFTEMKKSLYMQTNEEFAQYTHINHDIIVVHDPQPLPLIRFYKKKQPWIWRCHVDLSNPNPEVWDFLKSFILRYDAVWVSNEKYKSDDLPVEQRVIHPFIDPLSSKNIELPESVIKKYLRKFSIPTDKPIITQVSRFDKWKDPMGVVEVFKLVKEEMDCRLVLCGSAARDDPEATVIYEEVRRKAKPLIKSGDVILITRENNILVNALQRTAAVVLQKSLREGFGLTVTEALWKAKPVVASNVGGIPLQIEDGKSGYLVEPNDVEGFADRVIELMQKPEKAAQMGRRGRKTVKEKFLITRGLLEHIRLLSEFA
ncbi:glycosyltransferase [Methermicoccus shengliensis]|uniref:Glycosyltransferase n=1 Tax=Methermicoccus shengliensis TaxID=660064 RepID=A0A832VY27_9EURY|nr:glycosyltransferase [Methermicoccus shengliensis]KUK29699.1 MAG: Trehalose synthase [Methanosarcinales archeaon 56_1174]MDI3488038.1 trehalose synthase [Methanosarcinales archaeon]MDN5295659.1 trehalose synthase [Methanosarcinales archaeon]HIH70353.1 glycosyltransferase [Methermicoccus shengliensis]